MPYMTPTYPENIRLLGPSTWEEIGYQQTTDHRNSTPLSRIMHVRGRNSCGQSVRTLSPPRCKDIAA